MELVHKIKTLNKLKTNNDANYIISPSYMMTINDCYNGFQLFIRIDNEEQYKQLQTNKDLQKQVFYHINKLIDEIKTTLNKIIIPIDHLENIKYSEVDDEFYITIDSEKPTTLKLDCSFNQTIDDVCLT